MFHLKQEILKTICLENNLQSFELTCNTNCDVEPPALKFKCPNCADFTPVKKLKTPPYKELPLDKLIELVMNLTDGDLHITKLSNGYIVEINQDGIVEYLTEHATIELCLLDILSQLNLTISTLEQLFYLK